MGQREEEGLADSSFLYCIGSMHCFITYLLVLASALFNIHSFTYVFLVAWWLFVVNTTHQCCRC